MTKTRSRTDSLKAAVEGIRRADSIANYLSGLGDPSRDSGASGRPTLMSRLEPHELEVLYLQNDLAGIIVDEIVDDGMRNGFAVNILDEADSGVEIDAELERLQLNVHVSRAAKWGRLYGAGYVLMVLDDGLDPVAPVEREKSRGVLQLIDLDRWEVQPIRWQTDITRPGFGEPEIYQVSLQAQGGATTGLQVHASRLLKFGGAPLPRRLRAQNGGDDDSVLQRPWDAIRRFVEVEQAMANIVQSFERSTISISGLASVLSDPEGESLITKRMELLARAVSMINTVLLDADAGEQYERTSSSVAGLPELRDRFAESVAKAARMPQTILFGTAPEGLNTDGESGIQAWHKRVHAYQEKTLQPELERLIELLMPHDFERMDWDLEWNPLDEPTEKEIAEIRKTVAETDAIYLGFGVRSPEQVARSRDQISGWSAETIPLEQVEEDLGF